LNSKTGLVGASIPDETADTFEEASRNILKEHILDSLSALTKRERMILKLRFGIWINEDGKELHPMTLREVGKVIGVTPERIRQSEAKALRKLRHPSVSGKMKGHVIDEIPGKRPTPSDNAWKIEKGFETFDSLWERFQETHPAVTFHEEISRFREFINGVIDPLSYELIIPDAYKWDADKELALELTSGEKVYFQNRSDTRVKDLHRRNLHGAVLDTGTESHIYYEYKEFTRPEKYYFERLRKSVWTNGRSSSAHLRLSPNTFLVLDFQERAFAGTALQNSFQTIPGLRNAVEQGRLSGWIENEVRNALAEYDVDVEKARRRGYF
jgi:hypothetical protein